MIKYVPCVDGPSWGVCKVLSVIAIKVIADLADFVDVRGPC